MRRGVLAVLGTIAGTTLLVGAKVGTRPPLDPNAVALNADPAGAAAPPAAGAAPSDGAASVPAAGPSGAPPASGVPAATATPGSTRTSPKPGSTARTSPPAAPHTTAPASGLKNGSFTGAGSAAGQYGTVTVTITVSGGRITNLTQTYNAQSSTSQSISNAAFPTLRQEALSAQSAKIATVSGATYTSNAYKNSLQSAITSAKA
jgi:uncharacterized protein with FMN-binding domain